MTELTTNTMTAESRIGSQSANSGVITPSWFRVDSARGHLVTRRVVTATLEGQEFVDRGDRHRVSAAKSHLPAAGAIDHLVGDRRAVHAHDGRAGDDLSVYLEWLGEITSLERRRDVAHVLGHA